MRTTNAALAKASTSIEIVDHRAISMRQRWSSAVVYIRWLSWLLLLRHFKARRRHRIYWFVLFAAITIQQFFLWLVLVNLLISLVGFVINPSEHFSFCHPFGLHIEYGFCCAILRQDTICMILLFTCSLLLNTHRVTLFSLMMRVVAAVVMMMTVLVRVSMMAMWGGGMVGLGCVIWLKIIWFVRWWAWDKKWWTCSTNWLSIIERFIVGIRLKLALTICFFRIHVGLLVGYRWWSGTVVEFGNWWKVVPLWSVDGLGPM